MAVATQFRASVFLQSAGNSFPACKRLIGMGSPRSNKMVRTLACLSLVAVIACDSGARNAPITEMETDPARMPKTSVEESVPDLTPEAAAQLRARAFVIGCEDIACEGQPIFASDIIPQEVRTHIRNLLASEVRYLTDEEADEIMGPPNAGIQPGVGAWIGVEEVAGTERPDVVSVMTYVDGPGRHMGTQTLFEWNGEAWVHVAADEVGVTVVTAVP